MSGIVGVLGLQGELPGGPLLQSLTQSLAFRGPDRQQSWVSDRIGLGHALLTTSPQSSAEQQPLSLDGQLWVVADARLDARSELLSQLQSAGHEAPKCAGDAELILRAYAAWGESCLHHFWGDFCFAIWDGNRRSLFCAHDQLAIKPFYYAATKRWLVFSNTLECIRMHPEVSSELNELGVADFLLFGSNQEPATTIFAAIHRLPPAHALTWRAGKLSVKRYWTPPVDEEIRYKHATEYEEQFRQLLHTAVKDRVRVGRATIAFSGGLDSTSVAAFARRLGLDELRAVTVVYDEVMPDRERYYSGLAGEALGIPIEYLIADRYVTEVHREFPEIKSPQPDLNVPAALAADFYELASRRSRILITGQGGDVGLFPSNSHFRRLLGAGRLGRFLHDGVQYAISQRGLPPVGLRTMLKRRFGTVACQDGDCPGWLNPEFERRLRLQERWKEKRLPPAPHPHPHRPEAIAVLLAPSWQNFLEACDPGTTRTPLEQVHPYFDLRLLRFLFSIPPIPWTPDKFLTRSAMRDILPDTVRLRPKAPLVDDPSFIFVRKNREMFLKAPPNLAAYVDCPKYDAFLNSPAAFSREAHSFTLRPALLSSWLRSTAGHSRNPFLHESALDRQR